MDPITYQVLQSRMSGIMREMQENVYRTGYSTILRESEDVSSVILDRDGAVVCAFQPLHVGSFPQFVEAIHRIYGDRIYPGDAFVSNHPYEAGIVHSADMAILVPLFSRGELVAFCGSNAHKSDLGGIVPGTTTGNSREIFHEGIQYPPVKYMERGEVVTPVELIIRANSRTPKLVIGDISGQIGTAHLGEKRLLELIDLYGHETFVEAMSEIQTKTEQRVRLAVRHWKDGVATGESFLDNDGVVLDRSVKIHVRVEKKGDRIVFDFSESGDQTTGPANIRPPVVKACCYYCMISLIDPNLLNNAGISRAIQTVFRSGSVLDPLYPAPTMTYMPTAQAVIEAIYQAMSSLVTDKKIAGSGGAGTITISGKRDDGSPYVMYEILGSAYGARDGKDGVSGVSVYVTNAKISPIEVLESEFPIRIRRFELISDSGGEGKYRGGLGFVRDYEILSSDAQLTIRGGKHSIPAAGVQDGLQGKAGACIVNPGGKNERSLPSRYTGLSLDRGDLVRVKKAGGGGYGDPSERPFERILDDVMDGYVSRECAVNVYKAKEKQLDEALADRETLVFTKGSRK